MTVSHRQEIMSHSVARTTTGTDQNKSGVDFSLLLLQSSLVVFPYDPCELTPSRRYHVCGKITRYCISGCRMIPID